MPASTMNARDHELDATERFHMQKCPTCGGSTVVPLCLAVADCERCGAPLEVAPLPRAGTSRPLRTAAPGGKPWWRTPFAARFSSALVLFWTGLASAQETPTGPEVADQPARAWVGVEERNAWGLAPKNTTADYGAEVLAGHWFLREHLEPVLDLGWSRVVRSAVGPPIDTFRAGGKLAMGSAAAGGHLWIGAALGAVLQAGWLHGVSSQAVEVTGGTVTSSPSTTRASLAWAVAPSLSVLVQGRVAERFLVGADLGIEHSVPALQWSTTSIFHSFRFTAGIELGILFGERLRK